MRCAVLCILAVGCAADCLYDALRTNGVASDTVECASGKLVGDQVTCAFTCGVAETSTCLGVSWFPAVVCDLPAPPTPIPPPPLCEGVDCEETECLVAECNHFTGSCNLAKPDGTLCTVGGTTCASGVCVKDSTSSGTGYISFIIIGFIFCVVLCVGGGFWRCQTHLKKIETQAPKAILKKKHDESLAPAIKPKKQLPIADEEKELYMPGKSRNHGCVVSESLLPSDENTICLSGVVPDGNADMSGFMPYVGRTILTVGNRHVHTAEEFDNEVRKTPGGVAKIGFAVPGMYTAGGLLKDTMIEVHSLRDNRGLNGERGKVVDSWGTGLSVHVKGKGVKFVPLGNVQVLEGMSSEQVAEDHVDKVKVDPRSTALFPPEEPSELTVVKDKGEGVGLRLQNLVIVGVRPGSPADGDNVRRYYGRRVTHVSMSQVASDEDFAMLTSSLQQVDITLAPEQRIDRDGKTLTLAEFLDNHGPSALRRWGLAKKLHEIHDKRSYGRGRGRAPPPPVPPTFSPLSPPMEHYHASTPLFT